MIAIATTNRKKMGQSWRDVIAHIVETYHDPLRATLPHLEQLADQVARERRVPIHVLDWLLREFSALADSLRTHLLQQEGHLFPMIGQVCELVERVGYSCHMQDTLDELMDEATREDQEAVASVKRVEHCLSGMDCMRSLPLVAKLVKGFRELREDLEEHVHLEINVLFPVVRELLGGKPPATQQLLAAGKSALPLAAFDDVLASDRWLDHVMENLGYRDRAHAGRALRSVLHALRDRLNVNEATTLGTLLPKEVRGLYYEDWQHRWHRATKPQWEDFLCEIAESHKDEPGGDPEEIARNIFRVLAKQIPVHEVETVKNILPDEIRSLWPSQHQPSPMAELIVADQETG